jgi:hypothetical protein
MKKRRFGIIAVILLAALVLIGCPMDSDSDDSGGGKVLGLQSIEMEEGSHTSRMEPSFSPSVYNYTYRVPEDTSGVLLKWSADDDYTVTINSNHVGWNGSGWNNETEAFKDGLNYYVYTDMPPVTGNYAYLDPLRVPGPVYKKPTNNGEPKGLVSVVIRDPAYNSFDPNPTVDPYVDGPFETEVTITVKKGADSKNYKVNIIRENGGASYALFEQKEYAATNLTLVKYNLYIPKNLAANEKVAVVYALHGGGEGFGPVDIVIKANQLATIWAKDSESRGGNRKCIVLAPQQVMGYCQGGGFGTDLKSSGWSAGFITAWTPASNLILNEAGEAGYELLQKILADHSANVDLNRVYAVGLSMGGGSALANLVAHPDTFAAGWVDDPAMVIHADQASILKDMPIYFGVAYGTPISYLDKQLNFKPIVDAARGYGDTAGRGEVRQKIFPLGAYFYGSAHNCWSTSYQDEESKAWLFSKMKVTP